MWLMVVLSIHYALKDIPVDWSHHVSHKLLGIVLLSRYELRFSPILGCNQSNIWLLRNRLLYWLLWGLIEMLMIYNLLIQTSITTIVPTHQPCINNRRLLITLSISILLTAWTGGLLRPSHVLLLERAWAINVLLQMTWVIFVWSFEVPYQGSWNRREIISRARLIPRLRLVFIPTCLWLHHSIRNRLWPNDCVAVSLLGRL